MLRIIFFICLIFLCAAPVFAQEPVQQNAPEGAVPSGRQFGIFTDFGFGFANNIRLSDWMNQFVEAQEADPSLDLEEDKSKRKEPLLYGGIVFEPRFFSGNIVLAPSFGYYDVSQGYREASNGTITYKQTISLSFFALTASVYYKISFDSGNFLLLGGGLGYYGGTLKNEWGYYDDDGAESEQTSKDSAWTIGVQTGLEYNILFFDSFAVSFGFVNRFAEAFTFDVDVGNDDDDDRINAGLLGIYLYTGCGYIF